MSPRQAWRILRASIEDDNFFPTRGRASGPRRHHDPSAED